MLRSCLKQYGGPLDVTKNRGDAEIFYRSSTRGSVEMHDTTTGIPFAVILEVQQAKGIIGRESDALLASKWNSSNLKRPTERQKSSVAKPEPTGEEPILLNKLARMALGVESLPEHQEEQAEVDAGAEAGDENEGTRAPSAAKRAKVSSARPSRRRVRIRGRKSQSK